MMNLFGNLSLLLLINMFLLNAQHSAFAREYGRRSNVYIFHSQEEEFYGNNRILTSIKTYFDKNSDSIDITTIPLENSRTNEQISLSQFLIKAQPPDIIITLDGTSLEYISKVKEQYFKNIPIVFCGIADFDSSLLIKMPNTTGIVEIVDMNQFLNMAISLHPDRKNFIVILDSTFKSRTTKNLLLKEIPKFSGHNFVLLENICMNKLSRLDSIESNSIILNFGLLQNSSGALLSPRKSIAYIHTTLNAPIYCLFIPGKFYGALCCRINSSYKQGYDIAELVKDILSGAESFNTPVRINRDHRYMFDYNLMEKFSVDPSLLPQNSKILNEPVTLFDKYGRLLLISFSVIILLICIIVFLIINARKRVRAEKALQESERKFRELTDMLPQTIFETDKNAYLTFTNRKAFEQFGYTPDEDLSKINVMTTVVPEDRNRAKINFERALKNEMFVEEYTALRKDGSTFPVLIHSTPITQNNTVTGLRGIIIDITDRKRNEEAVIDSEAKYRTLIEIQSEGVILIDLDENITFANPSANSIFGIINRSLIGRNLKEFTSEKEFNKLQLYSKDRVLGKKSVFELDIIRNDGSIGCINVTITPYTDRRGEIVGGFLVFTDITERKKSEADLIKAKEEAERSNKLKTEFLAQVSHEIRTPINSILSFTSLLKDELEDKIPEDLRSSFKIIENGGRRLIRTIDLILNMSQIQTGTYEGNMSILDIQKDVLDIVILDFMPLITEKKLGFNFKCNGVSKMIFADQYTVTQIFTNLIDNAIKYTPSGRIDLSIYKCTKELVVEVADTGIGISQEYLPYLFTAFSQEESGYTRRFDGNGLGLALVKKYCELNSARIEVDSVKGKGTRFRIYFPST